VGVPLPANTFVACDHYPAHEEALLAQHSQSYAKSQVKYIGHDGCWTRRGFETRDGQVCVARVGCIPIPVASQSPLL